MCESDLALTNITTLLVMAQTSAMTQTTTTAPNLVIVPWDSRVNCFASCMNLATVRVIAVMKEVVPTSKPMINIDIVINIVRCS